MPPGPHWKCTGCWKTIDWDYGFSKSGTSKRLRLVSVKVLSTPSSGNRPTLLFPEGCATGLPPALALVRRPLLVIKD